MPNEEFALIRRLVKRIGQRKDDLFYGLAAALIMEITVRLIVFLTTSPHQEKGTCKLPSALSKNLTKETISASDLGIEMKIGEPAALMLLNILEALDIVRVVDESSRTFKKTGKTSIPNVLGACFFREEQKAIASTVFHQVLGIDIKTLNEGNWQPELKKMRKFYEKLLKTE